MIPSKVGRAELIEVGMLDKANRYIFQPVQNAVSSGLSRVAQGAGQVGKYARVKARRFKRAATSAAVIPVGGLMVAANSGDTYQESKSAIWRAILREGVGDIVRKGAEMAKSAGTALAGTAKDAAQVAHDTKYSGIKRALRNFGGKVKKHAYGFVAKHAPEINTVTEILRNSQPQRGSLREAVSMSKEEFKREHVNLLKVLSSCKTAACKQEKKKQAQEMRKVLKK